MTAYRKPGSVPWSALLAVALFAVMFYTFLIGVQQMAATSETEQRRSLEQAVRRAVVQCYALEGTYPKSVTYLEQNYGLVVDHTRYIVHYEAVASNLFPSIAIFDAWKEGD